MEAVFLKILNMSITAGWLVLAVLLMRLLLKKAPRYLTVIMWALVGIRLVLPFSFECVLSLIPSTETVPPEILYDRSPEIQTGIDVLNNAVNPVISQSFAPDPSNSVNPLQILTILAGWVWLAGMVGMAIYALVSYLRIYRRVREAAPLQGNVWLCDRIGTPFILGLIRPRIYLPSAMAPEDIPYVLAHEQAHLKRKDHLWKPLGFLLLSVHWFNPLLWVAYILLCRDIEVACDEKVLKAMGEEAKKPYSLALINCSVPRQTIAACPLAFGEVNVKSRIKKVLNYKKPAFWLLIAAVVVCIVLSVCFLTNPRTVGEQMQIFLDCQIAEHFQTDKSAGNACCLDYEILGTKKKGKETTVYMWVLYEEYSYQNGELYQQTGSHIPTVITAQKEDGNYRLAEYWEPRDGAYNPGDIKDKFPIYLWPKAMDSQRYIDRQKAACLEMAEQYFKENPPGPDSYDPSFDPSADPDHLKNEPTEKQPENYTGQESLQEEDFLVFRYDGVLPEGVNAEVNTADMTVGCLYIFDAVLGKMVQVSDIASTEVYGYNYHLREVCFVPEDEPYRVYVMTYNTELGEIVGAYSPYVSHSGNITGLQYYGTYDSSKLLICEEGRVIVSCEMGSRDKEILMEAYNIEAFYYSPSSLFSKSFTENVSSEEMGDVIYWRGKLNEQDTESTYYYIVQKDEQWAENEWTVKEAGSLPITSNGFAFTFDGSNPTHYNDVDLSKCVVGSLYFIDTTTHKVYFVTDKPLVTYNSSGTHVFYVPKDEPSRIYAAPLADLTQHTLVYESENGKITDSLTTGAFQYFNTALQFVEDDRRYIWLDLTTGEAEVVLEQYYIARASVDTSNSAAINENGQWYLESTNVIYFIGKLNAADDLSQYLYYRDTGKIEEVFWL